MKFTAKHAFLFIIGFTFSSCQYNEADVPVKERPADSRYSNVIDTVRDEVMIFDVYDSISLSPIGTERWAFFGTRQFDEKVFVEYLVYRTYAFDSSGGRMLLTQANDGKVFRSEFNEQWVSFFLYASNPKYQPQDSVLTDYRYDSPPNGQKTISITWYKGVTPLELSGKTDYCFRADRDSTAVPSANKPFITKRESYFYSEKQGLVFMNESTTKSKFLSDSLVSKVYKIRRF